MSTLISCFLKFSIFNMLLFSEQLSSEFPLPIDELEKWRVICCSSQIDVIRGWGWRVVVYKKTLPSFVGVTCHWSDLLNIGPLNKQATNQKHSCCRGDSQNRVPFYITPLRTQREKSEVAFRGVSTLTVRHTHTQALSAPIKYTQTHFGHRQESNNLTLI